MTRTTGNILERLAELRSTVDDEDVAKFGAREQTCLDLLAKIGNRDCGVFLVEYDEYDAEDRVAIELQWTRNSIVTSVLISAYTIEIFLSNRTQTGMFADATLRGMPVEDVAQLVKCFLNIKSKTKDA